MNKIPKEAKKVFVGKIFDIYQWNQKLYDGSYKVFEKLRRSSSTSIVAISEGKLLVQEQEQPTLPLFISTPGGCVDPGEEPVDCAKRELLEECGYSSNHWELWFVDNPLQKIDWNIYYYIAIDCRKVKDQELDNGEKISNKLVTINELFELSLRDNFRDRELSRRLLTMKYTGEWDEFKKKYKLI